MKRFMVLIISLFLLSGTATASDFEIEISQGWNMISGSHGFQISELSEACEIESTGGHKVWSSVNGSWSHSENLNPSLGHFVYSSESCTVSPEISEGSEQKSLSGGWNMISASKNGRWRCSLKDGQNGGLWHFDQREWKKAEDISEIRETRGYWANLKTNCRMGVEQRPYPSLHEVPGTIQAENFDQGGQGVAYNDTTEGSEYSEVYRGTDVDVRQKESGSGKVIGFVDEGEYLEYTFEADEGLYEVSIKTSSDEIGKKLLVSVDGEEVGEVEAPSSGWSDFSNIKAGEINLSEGKHTLKVESLTGFTDIDSVIIENASREDSSKDSGELHPLLSSDKGVRVVEPGNLESAVDNMAEGGDPRPVFYSLIKLKPGETYTPEDTITLSDGQQIHAYGAEIKPQHDGPVFRMKRESKIYGGTIDLTDTGATAFRLPGGRRGFPKGPQGTRVMAEPGTGSTGFKVDADNYRGGRGTMYFQTDGVDYPVDLDIQNDGKLLYFNSHGMFLRATDYLVGINLKGDDATNTNRFTMDFTPSERSKAAVVFDHREASSNFFEGVIRDPQKHENLVKFHNYELHNYQRPKNTFALYDGTKFDSPPMWEDNTADGSGDRYDSSGNEMIDFSEASFQYNQHDLGIEGSGVLVADGSDFQATLNEAGRKEMNVRIESGTEVDAAGVTVPEDVAIDARGGRLEINTRYSSGDSGIRFEEGALLIGGRVFARMSGGPAITIRADGETIDEPTGPVGTMMQHKRESYPMLIEAVNGGEIRGLNNRLTAFAGEKGFRMHADESSSISDNRLSLSSVNMYQYNLKMHGEGEIANNVIDANLHASEGDWGEMDAIWIIDGPNVHDNRADGHFWDTGRWGVRTAWIKRSGGDNLYSNFFGTEYPPEMTYNKPPWDVRESGGGNGETDIPINDANSNYKEIGYEAIANEPQLLQRVSEDRLTPPSFSPFPFQ